MMLDLDSFMTLSLRDGSGDTREAAEAEGQRSQPERNRGSFA